MDNKELIQNLTEITEANHSNENFGPEELALKIGMSHSSLHRKLKAVTNQTISQFIREVRLKKAKELLFTEESTVSEIAYKVGFGSPTYFNKCFHEYYGVSPGELKKMESKPEKEIVKPNKRVNDILLFIIAPVLIFIFVFLFLNKKYSFLKNENQGEKSIVVLPFKFHGENLEKQYLADGTMNDILLHLSKIKELRVISGISVEQYRTTDKTAKTIGRELNVNHLLEGNLHQLGDNYKLFLYLKNTRDERLEWSENYDWNIEEFFTLYSKAAQRIAAELNAEITPEEKHRIEKIPTFSLTAYDFYWRGREEHRKYRLDKKNREALIKAEKYYHTALDYDSTFALAYTGLAQTYWDKNYWNEFFTDGFLDSVIILANIALSYDDQLSEAHIVRGNYYRYKGEVELALLEYDKAIDHNPNNSEAYEYKAYLYTSNNDYINAIDNFCKAAFRERGPDYPALLMGISRSFLWAGFIEKASDYRKKVLELNGDSANYFIWIAAIEYNINGNLEKAAGYGRKAFIIDSTDSEILNELGHIYTYLEKHEESLKYFQKYVERLKSSGNLGLQNMHRIGYAYFQNGYKEEADYFFNEQINYCNRTIELGRQYGMGKWVYYDLAGVYAFWGEKKKAIENLRIFNQKQRIALFMVNLINYDPLFDNIRDEPEFQQIVEDMEAKFQAEHERVRKWLDDQGLL